MEKIDVAVIGAGVIGLAIARSLSQAGREVIIIEAEKTIGSITSARNSGVIHAGIYYPKNSAKAQHCIRGKAMLYDYVKARNIPYKNCGKIIAAVTQDDLLKLQQIEQKARENGILDLRSLTKNEAMKMEENLSCQGAIYSPSTGIIDVHGFIEALLVDAEDAGSVLALQHNIDSASITNEGVVLNSGSDSILAGTLINAAGLGAQDLAHKITGLNPRTIPLQYLAKGNYFSISGPAPFKHLVYPVPVPGGLGAHFTMNMSGESLFGPDVEWLAEQNYRKIDYDVSPERAGTFKESIRRYWPGIDSRILQPAYSGVRPKISMAGAPDGDFIIQTQKDHGVKGLINLYGIESPGITSALSIAKTIAEYVTL